MKKILFHYYYSCRYTIIVSFKINTNVLTYANQIKYLNYFCIIKYVNWIAYFNLITINSSQSTLYLNLFSKSYSYEQKMRALQKNTYYSIIQNVFAFGECYTQPHMTILCLWMCVYLQTSGDPSSNWAFACLQFDVQWARFVWIVLLCQE